MTIDHITAVTAPVHPALVASAFDCLALFHPTQRLRPRLLIAVVCTVGGTEHDARALLVRIRAAAVMLRDPRWLPWSAYFKACSADAHAAFDAIVLDLVATLPLDASLLFSPNDFFDALLARVPVSGGD